MFLASARALRKDAVRIPMMIVAAFLTLKLGLLSVLGAYSFLMSLWTTGRIDMIGGVGVVGLAGIVAGWLRLSLPRLLRRSRTLRVLVVAALLLALAVALFLLVSLSPSVKNPLSWMLGAAACIGAFLIMATIGEGDGSLPRSGT